jgi:hypothetical protein
LRPLKTSKGEIFATGAEPPSNIWPKRRGGSAVNLTGEHRHLEEIDDLSGKMIREYRIFYDRLMSYCLGSLGQFNDREILWIAIQRNQDVPK